MYYTEVRVFSPVPDLVQSTISMESELQSGMKINK